MTEWLTVRLYRFHHDQGGSKDWAIAHDPQTVRIYYGKTDQALRSTTIPRACCREDSPAVEARMREQRKLAEGYQALGQFEFNLTNRRQLRSMSTSSSSPVEEDVVVDQQVKPVTPSSRDLLVEQDETGKDWFF